MSTSFEKLAQSIQEQHKRLALYGEQLAGLRPIVYFCIPAVGLHRWKYLRLIHNLLVEFVEKADPKNEQETSVIKHRGLGEPNQEGGISLCTVDGIFIDHCKMYVCDGTPDSRQHDPNHKWKRWRGLIFCDHADSNRNTAKVFIIADAFEKFLFSKGIKFKRINTMKERSK